MRIVFIGTAEFGVPSLEALIHSPHDVVAVITSTDKYGGRGGKKLIESPVKLCAQKHNVPILQPPNLKSASFIKDLKEYYADIHIVIAFRMLPEIVWNMPPKGTWNLHGSLLPKYRGAAPINWAIINGEKFTGITSFKLKHKIDTGAILHQEKVQIDNYDTFGTIYNKLKVIGVKVVLNTLESISSNNYELIVQDESKVSPAPKIFKQDCQINFNTSVYNVFNFIRGLSPLPGAWLMLDNKEVKILESEISDEISYEKPGTIITDNKRYVKIVCYDGYLVIKKLKMSGKKTLEIKQFLNGYTIQKMFIE